MCVFFEVIYYIWLMINIIIDQFLAGNRSEWKALFLKDKRLYSIKIFITVRIEFHFLSRVEEVVYISVFSLFYPFYLHVSQHWFRLRKHLFQILLNRLGIRKGNGSNNIKQIVIFFLQPLPRITVCFQAWISLAIYRHIEWSVLQQHIMFKPCTPHSTRACASLWS